NLDIDQIQFPRATDYIKEQIALAKTLEEKGFAYRISHGLAFDTARFPAYGKLGHIDVSAQKVGARIEEDREKKSPYDFWLWRAAKPKDLQQWDSPWGRGNPGWHIECSAMSRTLLGSEIDIHTGGEDHIAVHHNNEIAQSEAASGRTFVHYWMHNAFLTMNGEKIAKSVGNVAYLSDVVEHGFNPLALRYFFLQAHYRTPLSFSWPAIEAANGALTRLWRAAAEIAEESKRRGSPSEALDRFVIHVRDDLATPQALGTLWESLKSEEYTAQQKWALIERADSLLGLSLVHRPEEMIGLAKSDIPKEVAELLTQREKARAAKDFKTADTIRGAIENSGYRVEDGAEGPVLTRRG
ncbi:MAG TPA: class I tRNA ligase family protein, partial [Candidatus Paceibacterota bacterium]|nr:class I tRNA ligase family protein [Candidatus Paceibacterota bacterium]